MSRVERTPRNAALMGVLTACVCLCVGAVFVSVRAFVQQFCVARAAGRLDCRSIRARCVCLLFVCVQECVCVFFRVASMELRN